MNSNVILVQNWPQEDPIGRFGTRSGYPIEKRFVAERR